jgi:hypothetical protein
MGRHLAVLAAKTLMEQNVVLLILFLGGKPQLGQQQQRYMPPRSYLWQNIH